MSLIQHFWPRSVPFWLGPTARLAHPNVTPRSCPHGEAATAAAGGSAVRANIGAAA